MVLTVVVFVTIEKDNSACHGAVFAMETGAILKVINGREGSWSHLHGGRHIQEESQPKEHAMECPSITCLALDEQDVASSMTGGRLPWPCYER